jgi:N-acetylmuramoyl-L-alanine amidase
MRSHAKDKGFFPFHRCSRAGCAFALRGTISALWKRMHRVQNLALLCAVACLAGLSGCASVATNTSHTFDTVVIDAGHGGKDSGAVRRYSPAEKTLALDVALRVDQKLRESQLRTVLTRNNDTFIPLDTRVAMGNAENNSIFVSIHFNDSRRRGVRGVETYYHSPYAYDLATAIEQKLDSLPGAENRGVHQARYRVIRNAHYPSVLVECGYLSNRGEGAEVSNAAYREQLADKIAEAIVDYRFGRGVYHGPSTMMATQSSAGTVGTGFR